MHLDLLLVLAIVMISHLNGFCLRTSSLFSPLYRGSKVMMSSKSFLNSDTIYALSSGSSTKCGVSVVRLSGPQSRSCVEKLIGDIKHFPKPRMASLRTLKCPTTKMPIDKCLVLWFPSPKSFTGEDVVELHVHGSRAVIHGLFQAFDDMNSPSCRIRMADHGEFTQRAFGNGKLDLTEVEGLSDLLNAETSLQRIQALRQMDGEMRRIYENWREELIHCLAHTEAVIDFGDDDREGDIAEDAMNAIIPRVQALRQNMSRYLHDNKIGEIIREGVNIAIIGPPNAGKSSLLNALARRPAAIVSPIAGTTRDIVEVRMDLGGISCILRDTAGIRKDSSDVIEQEGIRRSLQALETSHLCLAVGDISQYSTKVAESQVFQDALGSSSTAMEGSFFTKPVVYVWNKKDLVDGSKEDLFHICRATEANNNTDNHTNNNTCFLISCKSGDGINELESALIKKVRALTSYSENTDGEDSSVPEEGALITRSRHRGHLMNCVQHLENFEEHITNLEVASEELRLAARDIGKITGRVDVEELLDVIFRDFCIGK